MMTTADGMNAVVTFDYALVTNRDDRQRAKQAAKRIRSNMAKAAPIIGAIGEDLLMVKARLGHGLFMQWLDAEFSWTPRTAENYMSVAERLGGKYETVSHLPATTVYRLAAKSTPDNVRNEIVALLEAGDHLTETEIDNKIKVSKAKDKVHRDRHKEGKVVRKQHLEQVEQARALAKLGDLIANSSLADDDGLTEFMELLAVIAGDDSYIYRGLHRRLVAQEDAA